MTLRLLTITAGAGLLLVAASARAQTKESEIGVDEKLGQTVPLDLTFYDEQGEPVVLKDLMGERPVILTLVFYTCQGICTPLLNGLADVIRRNPQLEPERDFRIITISFDPQDTPARAEAKRKSYLELVDRKIDPDGWRFLTGNQENIDKICDAVGFRYVEQEGTFIHSGALTILTPDGKIARYLYGGDVRRNMIPFLPFEIQLALSEASEGRVGPTVNKVLRLCFQYDQAGKRYVLSITRISMTFVAIFAICVLLYVTVFSRIGRETPTEVKTKTDTAAVADNGPGTGGGE